MLPATHSQTLSALQMLIKAFAEIEGGQEVTPDTFADIVLSETVRAVTTHASGPFDDVLFQNPDRGSLKAD